MIFATVPPTTAPNEVLDAMRLASNEPMVAYVAGLGSLLVGIVVWLLVVRS